MNQSTKSDFNVEVVRITSVDTHPNADRLAIYQSTAGYPCVDRKDAYRVGDLAVYVPVDAIVPLSNPAFAFLKKREDQTEARINAVRLRGVYSEGLLVSLYTAGVQMPAKEGDLLQDYLSIKKYASRDELLDQVRPKVKGKVQHRKSMPVYGLDSLVRFQDAIKPGTQVIITEKIHGCNARYRFENGRLYVGSHKVMRGDSGSPVLSWLKNTWRNIKHLLKGSTRAGNLKALAEAGDIWWRIAEQYKLKDRLSKVPGLTFYGEIYGKGLQVRGGVDFCYDAPDGLKFRVFDIWDDKEGTFLSWEKMALICADLGLERSPFIYEGPWIGQEHCQDICSGKETLTSYWSSDHDGKHIKEGGVVRTDVLVVDPRRIALKYVSPEYKLLGGKDGK